jgi:1,4-dihydroxy-2-naphthoate octaprenyltransferase
MLMIVLGMLSPVTYLAMSLYVLSGLIYVLPITRFSDTGYGEILLTVLVAVMPPILSYLIRTGELHRFLPMLSFPVACSFLAFLLLDQFTHYSQDQLRGSKTMLSRMGWQTGLRFYYGLMISIYLFIALAVWFGLPIKIAWPACLSFPFALISTWQMGRMAEGAQPGWNLMKLTSQALCASLVYFFTLALWIN